LVCGIGLEMATNCDLITIYRAFYCYKQLVKFTGPI
jgi:hypothetical protein